MKKTLFVLLIVVLAIGLIFAGCAKQEATTPATTTPPTTQPQTTTPSAQQPKMGGTLKVLWDTSPGGSIGWPVELVGDASSSPQICIEPFFHQDNKGNMIPWLATSYKVASDLTSITFTLRQGVKFHDGTDFNAQAAKWNLDQQIDAKLQPFWKSVDVVDDYTVRVNLTSWRNTILTSFADGTTSWMVSPTAYQKNGLDWMRNNPVGTGPFKFVSFARDTGFKAVKNPDYWQKGKPYLDAIEISYVTDPITRKAVFQSGGADVMIIEPGVLAQDLQSDYVLKVKIETNTCLFGDVLDADSPWSKQSVREAIEYAIDREAIASGLGYGFWKAVYQVPSRDSTVYNPNFTLGRKYDPDKAKQLLNEAGYPTGFSTSIAAAPFSQNKDVFVAVQNYLSKVGIQTEIAYPDFGTYIGNYYSGPPMNSAVEVHVYAPANYNGVLVGYSKPSPYLNNWGGSSTYDDLMTKSLSSPEPDVNLMRAVTDEMTKEAIVIPLREAGRSFALQKYVQGGEWLLRSMAPWWNADEVWLDK
jgi:peptide/nickel transport system substrate-binding protein